MEKKITKIAQSSLTGTRGQMGENNESTLKWIGCHLFCGNMPKSKLKENIKCIEMHFLVPFAKYPCTF